MVLVASLSLLIPELSFPDHTWVIFGRSEKASRDELLPQFVANANQAENRT